MVFMGGAASFFHSGGGYFIMRLRRSWTAYSILPILFTALAMVRESSFQ